MRRGADVVKTIALGADVVVIGRLAAHGLVAGARPECHGVRAAPRRDHEHTHRLGRGSLADLTRDALVGVEAD
ncbi:MAG TPA: alpha-hydroxy-acid oxidizing protein [Jiangellales bacterium]|nr:alpha-hydroxy-acid oxidizing protein [Jiangellales bacterium]